MERLTFNASGPYLTKLLHGREHWVVPFTSLVEGVLNGSKGPLYYPRAEIAKDPGVWNGIPVTLGHPHDPRTGLPSFARDPAVLNRVGLGQIYKDIIKTDGARGGEAWIDRQLLRNRARGNTDEAKDFAVVNHALENGLPIELSTGLQTTDVIQNEAGYDRKGRWYKTVATNYQPDHLAVLVGQKGACSLNDGCGLGINAMKTEDVTIDTEQVDGFLAKLWNGTINLFTKNAVPNQPRHKGRGQYMPPNAGSGAGEEHDAAKQGFGRVCPECGGVLDDAGYCPACADRDAKHSVDGVENGTGAEGDPLKIAPIAPLKIDKEDDKLEVPKVPKVKLNQGDREMDRKATISFLVTNCDCWKGKEKLLENKDLFDDRTLAALKNNAVAAKSAETVVNAMRTATGNDALTINEMPAALMAAIAKKKGGGKKDDEEEEPAPDDEEKEVEEPVKNARRGTLMNLNELSPAQLDSLSKMLTGMTVNEAKEMAAENRKHREKEKKIVINKLLAHVPEERKAERVKRLLTLSLNELYDRLADMPQLAVVNQDDSGDRYPVFGSGMDDDLVGNRREDDSGETEILGLPTMNWSLAKTTSNAV